MSGDMYRLHLRFLDLLFCPYSIFLFHTVSPCTSGGRPLPAPLSLQAHRWGSARTSRPLTLQGSPCIPLSVQAAAAGSKASERGTGLGAASAESSRESHGFGQGGASQQGAALVVAGDFCVTEGRAGVNGCEAAVLSGMAAAQAVLKMLRQTGSRL